MTTVKITREQLALVPGKYQRHAFKWLYSYQVDDGPIVEYGTTISALRDYLKRKYKGAMILQEF